MSIKLPLRELRRNPNRFVVATVVLAFLTTLLLILGGLLDGLYLGSTGAIRAQKADAIVYSASARDSFLRSRITPEIRAQVEALDGVTEVGGIGFVLLGAQVPGESDLADVAVAGYELAPRGVPAPPANGMGVADSRLQDQGVSKGDTILVGPAETPITITGWVDDTGYLLQGSVWVNLTTWRAVQNANRPDSAVADDVVQALVVRGEPAATSSLSFTDGIDTATAGATKSLTVDDAVLALPGVKQQKDTFNQIIYTTLFVVLAVVGLFFSLLTLERIGLYGVLKAIGATTGRLFVGVLVQAIIVAVIAFAFGSGLAIAATAALPAKVPLQLIPSRFVFTFIGLLVAAILGSAISLRRVTKVEPASAIGTAS